MLGLRRLPVVLKAAERRKATEVRTRYFDIPRVFPPACLPVGFDATSSYNPLFSPQFVCFQGLIQTTLLSILVDFILGELFRAEVSLFLQKRKAR